MSDIVLSQGVRQNLLSLQKTADLLGVTQNRLATGKKVNSALDNPGNFFTASGLNARASDLGRLLDGIGQAVKTLEAADGGIKALTKLVETAQATMRQALQSASTSPKVVAEKATSATTALVGAAPALGMTAGDQLMIKVGAAPAVSIAVAAGDTVQNLIDKINTNTTLNPAAGPKTVRASLDDFGKLRIETLDGNDLGLEVQDSTSVPVNRLKNLFGTNVPDATGVHTVKGSINTVRQAMAKQFDELLVQMNQVAKDASYNGINLLNAESLRVVFNEANTSSLVIEGVRFSADGLGIGGSISQFQSDADIAVVVDQLTKALTKLRSQASTFGANLTVVQTRQDFTKQAILTLNTGADQLVLADNNEEGANLLALQTRQQLSQTALSMAAQADQAVLRLFGG
ncbi:flagellin [Chelatococcus sp. SYSU_G07232]|uniref:Flagellin n=1 Tax=Chelatococcus albus TaxID=3047466 RepID=A0ABT7AGG0_9HYPH|nr:flagellin [Chelatococcus sp. SYSU_G07232]MDJ1158463.1 flagellin [Chelatococcus sp. SYSU_G07232]